MWKPSTHQGEKKKSAKHDFVRGQRTLRKNKHSACSKRKKWQKERHSRMESSRFMQE